MTEFEVANVVGTITYQQELDLDALAETFSEYDEITSVIYEPAENHWLQSRFAPDDTYVPFYRSGKCSIVGTESLEHFYKVSEQVNEVMRELLEFDYEPVVELKNIVATTELDTIPSLETLTIGIGLDSVEYEPEQFPVLLYRGNDYVMLVFSDGKVVCTGLTDPDEIATAIECFTSQIKSIV